MILVMAMTTKTIFQRLRGGTACSASFPTVAMLLAAHSCSTGNPGLCMYCIATENTFHQCCHICDMSPSCRNTWIHEATLTKRGGSKFRPALNGSVQSSLSEAEEKCRCKRHQVVCLVKRSGDCQPPNESMRLLK
jgi:hypothetical protein